MNFISFIILLSCYFIKIISSEKVYNIKEEIDIGYVIDYVKLNGQKPIRIFNLNDTGVNCFSLDVNSGKLIIVKRLDRERLCQVERLKKYRNNQCEIVIKLAYEAVNIFDKVVINVEDINDHDPNWTKPSVTISFNENDSIGSKKSLPEAIDLDVGPNSQITYQIESKYRNHFRLFQDNGLYIELSQLLDREKQDMYEIRLIASDNGIPFRSNELKIIIKVNDINDNTPKFTKSVFRPEKLVKENIPLGSVILTLTAEDSDAEKNGEFKFYMNQNTVKEIMKYFIVKSNGDVIVESVIDYDNGDTHFEFKVIVEDNALSPYSRSSEAVVEIDIQDVNDEFPKLSFYAHYPEPFNNQATIKENLPIMTAIGLLTVKDVDFKNQDKVSCEIGVLDANRNSPIAIMTTNDIREFQVVSNKKFDRELQTEIYGQVICIDGANHISKLNITILVNDVNDHSPFFTKSVFHLYINENQPIGTPLNSRIIVTDKDSGNNGIFQLSIEQPEDKLFIIDQKSQTLRSSVIFDREATSKYTLKVLAIDNGANKLTSSCTVYVHIRDINDNPVILSSSIFSFHILENNKPRSTIGTITATDLDNQTIFYTIDFASQIKFDIEKHSGKLIVQRSLDREDQDVYYVMVIASDGFYSATATATILIDDVNDNPPIFVNPNNSNKIIKVDMKETPGYRISTILATDRDHGENGIVKYTLKKKDQKSVVLNLDGETGNIYLASSLQNYRLSEPSIILDIEACDQGQPRLCTLLTNLEIRWNSPNHLLSNQDNSASRVFNVEYFLNENVLILAISGLLVFMIIIMVAFVLIKQKSEIFTRRRNPTSLTITSKSMNKTLVTYPNQFAPPNYRCSTELENLDGDMLPSSDARITPLLHCSNLYLTDSKSKNDLTQFRCESAPTNISPMFDVHSNMKDVSKRQQINQDNYYSKYMTDRYCKISNAECPILKMESSNFNKIRNSKNHSSFV